MGFQPSAITGCPFALRRHYIGRNRPRKHQDRVLLCNHRPVYLAVGMCELYELIYRRGIKTGKRDWRARSEEHTSELQSLKRISYAVFCWKKTTKRSHKSMTI